MIGAAKEFLKRHWPRLRLRTILLAVLLFAAAMPLFGGVFLRVYENALVRQTEAELVAQGAAMSAVAGLEWPGAPPPPPTAPPSRRIYVQEGTEIDLGSTPILPERPRGEVTERRADAQAVAVARRLEPVIERTTRTTLASVVMLDSHGVVVRGYGMGRDLSALPEVRAALRGRPATTLRRRSEYDRRYAFEWLSRASQIRLHHARPIVVGGRVKGVLLMSRSPRALFRGIYEDRGKIALGAGVILLALVFLSGLVSRGVTRPIVALSRASAEVAAGHGAAPETPTTAAVEIQELYENFAVMSEAIARRSGYLRDFAAAVSHEFKTPLAGIGGAVELLQDHGESMSQAERARFLANIAADSSRLGQLVTRLLDLARADMARPEADVSADLAAPVRRVVDGLAASDLSITVDLPPTDPVAVPARTVEVVLTTLIENSRQAGASRVEVSARQDADLVLVRVTDNGPGIPEADRARLFEPFFTTRRSDGGTGLGLSIAESLLAASNARIACLPFEAGAVFEVSLPLAR
ncbi:MAG: HAMP domain-containing histidine kinase [Caulobacteraceae bacterium]|nr:HAMP domain-containing histidine kinase [Caulobacteraceae bacterium]